MPIINQSTEKYKFSIILKCVVFIAINLFVLSQSNASEISAEQYTVSQGTFKKELNDERRKMIIETSKLSKKPDQLTGKASSKSREVMIKKQKYSVKKSSKNNILHNSNHNDYADFAIYGASSLLQDDFDGDGYYQTFSVVFDADIYSYSSNQFGEVYALLYLSKNGEPWTHYFTTDSFIIESDTDLDEYEVITTILTGYSTDHYDVLIDLYQVGYDNIVASYNSDDSNALYSLPLESSDYDEPYVEYHTEIVETSGGSFSTILIFFMMIRFIYELQCSRNNNSSYISSY